MHVVHDVRRGPRLAVKGHEDQPPGIEAGEGRRDHQHDEGKTGRRVVADKGGFDDHVLGEKAGKPRKTR